MIIKNYDFQKNTHPDSMTPQTIIDRRLDIFPCSKRLFNPLVSTLRDRSERLHSKLPTVVGARLEARFYVCYENIFLLAFI